MNFDPQSLPMDDSDWRQFVESASEEITADIDAALMRCAQNNSLADAILLAGYLQRGHIFEGK